MKIVCAGLPKTGTKTFAEAMDILGFNHRTRDAQARRLYLDGLNPSARLRDVDSVDDLPWPLVIDRIKYPMKVVLTVRESPEQWVSSVHRRIKKKGTPHPSSIWHEQFCNMQGVKPDGELIQQYMAHNAAVERFCREHGVPYIKLCWEKGDAWTRLCWFLGVDVPAHPFPWSNAS